MIGDVLAVVALAVVAYYVAWALLHLGIVLLGVVQFDRLARETASVTEGPPLTVVVPAYDERRTVRAAVESLLASTYPVSVILVDDGSTDGTLEVVASAYDLQQVDPESSVPADVTVYRAQEQSLTVLRQDNAGKSAALNRALSLVETPLFGVVDADTVVEPEAIGRLVDQFADESVVAAGGSFRVAATPSASGRTVEPTLSGSWFERFQALDHLRVFVLRQLGRARLGLMVQVFGACSVFRTELVRAVGGFEDVETEDFELAVALRRHCVEHGRDCRFVHVPTAIAWTTVPADLTGLSEQRQRWIRGATETVSRHRRLLGRPAYGRVGMVALPYILFGEIGWLLVEAFGYVLVPAVWLDGHLPLAMLGAFLVAAFVLCPVASAIAIVTTGRHRRGYDRGDRRSLLVTTLVERLVWRPAQVLLGVYSVVDFARE